MICFLLSPFDARIKINDNFFNVTKNELFPIPIGKGEITVFACHTSFAFFVPYVLNEKNSKTYVYEQLNAKVVEINNNLFLKQNKVVALPSNFGLKIEFLNKGKSFVKISAADKTCFKELPALCHSPQIFENENYVVVYAQNFEGGFSLAVFNKTISEFCMCTTVSEILIKENTLNLLDSVTPIGTAKSTAYDLSLQNFTPASSFYVNVNQATAPPPQKGLVLFHAVKSGYFSLAKSLLSPSMQQIATDDMLTAYFKDFNKITLNPFSDKTENYLVFSENTISNVNFTLNNDLLIDNISKK